MAYMRPLTEAEKQVQARRGNKERLQAEFAEMGVSGEEEALEKYKKKKLLREQRAGLSPRT
jgi:hypothetical protein